MNYALRTTALAALFATAACGPRISSASKNPTPALSVSGSVAVTRPEVNGPWEERAQRALSRPNRTVHFAALASSALPDFELVRDGEVIGRVTTAWSTSPGGQRTRIRLLTLYRDGAAARTIPLPGEATTPIAHTPGASVPTVQFRTVAASAGGGGFVATRPVSCAAQYDAMFGAIDSYWAADAALGNCLSNPFGCLGASISLIDSWRDLMAAERNLGSCLGAI